MTWVIAVALLALARGAAELQERSYFFQYLFFGRYAVVTALLLAALPLASVGALGGMVGNLFVLEAPGLGLVVFLAILAAWSATFALLLVYLSAPSCYKLFFLRGPPPSSGENPLPAFLRSRFGPSVGALMALPLILVLCWRSPDSLAACALAVVAAMLAAFGAWRLWMLAVEQQWDRFFAQRLGAGLGKVAANRTCQRVARTRLARGIVGRPAAQIAQAVRGRKDSYGLHFNGITHFNSLVFLLLALAVYVLVGTLAGPDGGWLANRFPPLAFVILLLITACLGLTGAAYWLDVYRIPVLLLLLAVSLFSAKLFDIDHYYALTREPPESPTGQLDAEAAVRAWAARHPSSTHPALVVVAASGGGIRAAVWTAKVLAELRTDAVLGARFAQSIVLLSTVSGGSVGAMYFVDGYTQAGPPTEEVARRAVDMAGTSSLSAVAWGWVYPDLWRFLFPLLARDFKDRGWAVEQRWRSHLSVPESTVGGWRAGVREGWRPVQVFNATLVETGEILRISPLDDPPPAPGSMRRSRSFRQLYAGLDIELATAARLSATFPYVSPIAKPPAGATAPEEAYHVADGGYVDNYGVVTAREFIEAVIAPCVRELERERVVLVEIRASPETGAAKAEAGTGWIQAMAGPVLAMYNVRSASQVERNERELGLSIERWKRQGAEVTRVQFILDCKAALSWHLTAQETARIEQSWGSPGNQAALAALREQLRLGP